MIQYGPDYISSSMIRATIDERCRCLEKRMLWIRTLELTSRGVVVPAWKYPSASCNDMRELSDNKYIDGMYETDPYTSQHATLSIVSNGNLRARAVTCHNLIQVWASNISHDDGQTLFACSSSMNILQGGTAVQLTTNFICKNCCSFC